MNFLELPSNPLHEGIQFHFKAKNGYGASIVRHSFSYGSKQGLWEVAILDKDGSITYDTPITDNVLGYLTEEEVNEILLAVEELDI